MTVTKNGRPIRTIEEWCDLASPKSPAQWSEGRSAMEAARLWLGVAAPALPAEVAAVLTGHPAFGPVLAWSAEPEVRLRFDQFRGEPRNTVLLVRARDARGEFLLAVEAKADESFGETVAEALAAAVERRIVNAKSRGIERVERLAASLLGPRRDGEAALGRLRYQLLTATAGAIATSAGNQVQRVILLIHEFKTHRTVDEKHARNGRDLDAFVHRLSHGSVPRINSGTIHGPFEVPGAPLFGNLPSFFIAKVTCDIRAAHPVK
jgi:hypothetical protein